MKRRTISFMGAAFLLTLTPLIGVEEPNAVLSSEVQVTPAKEVPAVAGEVNGKDVPYCIHFDPAKWEITKEINNPAAEFAFKRKGEPLFAFIIPETTPVPLDMMAEVVVHNATSKGMKDVKILKKEKKTVDGREMLYIDWEGVFGEDGTKITYMGAITSGAEGTIQFYTFTLSSFHDLYHKDMEEMLKGLCFKKV